MDESRERKAEVICDSHAHLLPEARSRGLVRWIQRAFPGHPSTEDMTHERMLADLRDCGVETIFNLVFPLKEEETGALNLFNRDLALRHRDVVPFGSMHVETPRKEKVAERCLVEYGMAGIKLHPYVQGFEAFSREFEPLYRFLDEMGRPLLSHTGFDVFYSRAQDLDYLRVILERYGNMPVVLVHALFPRFRLAHELMEEYPHLYLDMTNVVSAVRWFLDSPESIAGADSEDIDGVRHNLEHFYLLVERFSSRIMFGTDHPAGMGSPRQIYGDFDSFGFPPGPRADLLGRTALSFLAERCGVAPGEA